jgi:hypothetical protein
MFALQWETAQESNSSHFTVEHSVNGTDWTAVGTVKAAGNSSTAKGIHSFIQQPSTAITSTDCSKQMSTVAAFPANHHNKNRWKRCIDNKHIS